MRQAAIYNILTTEGLAQTVVIKFVDAAGLPIPVPADSFRGQLNNGTALAFEKLSESEISMSWTAQTAGHYQYDVFSVLGGKESPLMKGGFNAQKRITAPLYNVGESARVSLTLPENTDGLIVIKETYSTIAEYYAEQAKLSAQKSEQAKQSANESAQEADTSSRTAVSASGTATQAKNTAIEAKNEAKISADNALESARLASQSEVNAKASEVNAKSSENVAVSSAQTATTKATESSQYAASASESAASANQSATTAEQAKTGAEKARDQAKTYGEAAGIDANGNQTIEGNQRVKGISTHDQVINAIGGVANLPDPERVGEPTPLGWLDGRYLCYLDILVKDYFNNITDSKWLFKSDNRVEIFNFAMDSNLNCFQMFHGATKLKVLHINNLGKYCNLEELANGSTVENITINAVNSDILTVNMLAYMCINLQTLRCNLGKLSSLYCIAAYCYNLIEAQIEISRGLTSIVGMVMMSGKLRKVSLNDTSSIIEAGQAYQGCEALEECPLIYPSLIKANMMFLNCKKITKQQVEAIMTSLPDRTGLTNNTTTGEGVITFTGCNTAINDPTGPPDWTIAENKNWIVER